MLIHKEHCISIEEQGGMWMEVLSGSLHVAGPMVNGATQVLFEGVPTYPDAGRAWDIVDKYKVS